MKMWSEAHRNLMSLEKREMQTQTHRERLLPRWLCGTICRNAGGAEDVGSIPGSGRSPGGGNGSPLQYSCLENPMDRGAWWATQPMKWSEVAQSCPTLCDPMDCSLPGFSVHGIFQVRVLEWVAISFSRRSSWLRDWTQVSCIAGRRFTLWATREATQPIGTCIESDTTEWLSIHTHTHTHTHTEAHVQTQSQGADSHVRTEAETGVMQPQAKDCVQPPEAGRGQERPSPGGLRGRTALQTL